MTNEEALEVVQELANAAALIHAPDAPPKMRAMVSATSVQNSEALRIVLELARKAIAPPVECSHGRGQTHRGWCSRCNQWACLACGAIVPAGKGPRCVDCREAT